VTGNHIVKCRHFSAVRHVRHLHIGQALEHLAVEMVRGADATRSEAELKRMRLMHKRIGRYGALLPLFQLVGVPCIAAFWRVKSLLCHHSDRPKLRKHVGRLFRRCDFFDWSFVGFGFFAMPIRNIQEPSDEAGAALLHDLRILGLLLIVKKPVIFRVAHGILHLLSAPTINQLRFSVYCSRASGHPRP